MHAAEDMQVTTIKISLSRLHKLVERIKDRLKELNEASAAAIGASKTWRTAPTEESLKRAREGVEAGFSQAREALSLAAELAKVRAIIATANQSLGQNLRLAQVDTLNGQLRTLRATLATAQARDSISDLPAGTPVGEYGLTTGVVLDADVKELQKLIDETQRQIYSVSDEIAELNATRLDVSLREDIAALVTT